MEDNRKFELSDELLDDVAGGTGTGNWSVGDKARFTRTGSLCGFCYCNWEKLPDGPWPVGTVMEVISDRGGGLIVVLDCCQSEICSPLSSFSHM